MHLIERPSPTKPISAIVIAQNELQQEFDAEHMMLNGRPIKLPDLMREVNRRRVVRGESQILYSHLWRVEA